MSLEHDAECGAPRAALSRERRREYASWPRQRFEVEACGRTWLLERTRDMESLWDDIDEDEFGDDERLPYWAELWPASLLLAEWLKRSAAEIAGRPCLDLGCGLGLTAIVAADLGARVVGLDYEWPAVFFARENAGLNRAQAHGAGWTDPLWVQMDWRRPGFMDHGFARIWGGDILYEKRFFEPIAGLLESALAPGGKVWMAEPERTVSRPVWERLEERGWATEKRLTEKVTLGSVATTVRIWELTR